MILLLLLAANAAAGEPRQVVHLSGTGWEAVETRDVAERPPEAGWKPFVVPGLVQGTGEGGAAYAWFRRDVAVPAPWAGKRLFLILGGARWDARVFVDGTFVGGRIEGFTPFEAEVTKSLKPGARVSLVVRCRDWSATFAPGYALPPTTKGELRYFPAGKVLYPIGGHFTTFGLWDDVRLEARPAAFTTDLAIESSVRRGALAVRGGADGAPRGSTVAAEVMDGSRVVLTSTPAGTGRDGRWALAATFPGATAWSPERPHLYTLRTTLRNASGEVLDVQETVFGFRELWAEGPDLVLNGVKRRLLATSAWPSVLTQTREQVREIIGQVKAGNAVAMRLHTQPWREIWLEEADRAGLMIVDEAALWCDASSYAYADDRFWVNYRSHVAGMVARDRNHASLVMWSLENELLHCGAGGNVPETEARLADLARFTRALDPGRLITFEADLDPGGEADVIGLHYPHELPDHADYPDTADWLDREVKVGVGGGLMGSRGAGFKWDRSKPLYIGEFLWVPTGDGTPGTVFFGDASYGNIREFDMKAKAAAWEDQILAYRRAGVSAVCPWTAFEGSFSRFPLDLNPDANVLYQAQARAYEPLAVFLRERDVRWFAGDTIARTADVFNDTVRERRVTLRWACAPGGAAGSRELVLAPAAREVVRFEIVAPSAPGKFRLAVELREEGRTVHAARQDIRVHARTPLAAPAGFRLALYDPAGMLAAALEREGVAAERVDVQAPLPPPARTILIVGPGAFPALAPESGLPRVGGEAEAGDALAGWLSRGGRALVLDQGAPEAAGLGLAAADHASTMMHALAPDDPLLAGLADEDLRHWRPGHYVTRRETRRPGGRGVRTVVASGGARGLDQAVALDVPAGEGRAIVLQALVAEKLASEPAARRLFANALRSLAKTAPPAGRTLLAGGRREFVDTLRAMGLRTEPPGDAAPSPADLVLLDGAGGEAAPGLAALASFVTRGGTLYWHDPDPEAFRNLCAAAGAGRLELGLARGPLVVRNPGRGLLAGVAREDLRFLGPRKGWNWGDFPDPDPGVIAAALAPGGEAAGGERIEAEALPRDGGYTAVAQDGAAAEFYTNGGVTAKVRRERAGTYALTVVAGGTANRGTWPLIEISVNGAPAAQVGLAEGARRPYPCLIELPAGAATLRAAFVNDTSEGGEDRNCSLDALVVGRTPWRAQGIEVLALPPALAVIKAGKGRIVLDAVRWDTNAANAVRGRRFASTLLRNLGARFEAARGGAAWVPARAFAPASSFPNFSAGGGELRFGSNGAARAEFEVVRGGTFSVLVRGSSDPLGGVYGEAEVAVDGARVGAVELHAADSQEFAAGLPVTLTAGRHTVSVAFTNDAYDPPADRNLRVTAVGFIRAE